MVTLGVSLLLGELANRNGWLTGGADGLNFSMGKVLGLFPIGFTGQRNAALYSFVVLFVLFAVARRLAQSPFGLALAAIRENRLRAGALGIATSRRIVAIYTVSAAYAGVAGALLAQTTQIVSLDLFDFHRSADVMLMLIIGGAGYLYGGLIGAAVFIVLRDVISAATPEYWEFWIGALLGRAGADRPRAHPRRRRARRFARRFSPSARGHGVSAPALEARGLSTAVRRAARHRQRVLQHRAGRAAGADRPQRRRQDDADQSVDRRRQADRGAGLSARPRRHRAVGQTSACGSASRAPSRSISSFPI